MINFLKSIVDKEQFKPTILGLFLNPFYFSRRAIFKNVKFFSSRVSGKTLDVGCGRKPYESLFKTEQYIGMDVPKPGHNHENEKVDVYYDGENFPFENNHFDSVVCFEVLEHIFNADEFLNEINRVMKTGGCALFTAPFIWFEHEKPYDFARYSSFGLKNIFEKHGFQIIASKKYLNDFRLLFLLANAYIYNVFERLIPNKLRLIPMLFLTSILNILGHVSFILPKNDDLYFGNIFVIKKIR